MLHWTSVDYLKDHYKIPRNISVCVPSASSLWPHTVRAQTRRLTPFCQASTAKESSQTKLTQTDNASSLIQLCKFLQKRISSLLYRGCCFAAEGTRPTSRTRSILAEVRMTAEMPLACQHHSWDRSEVVTLYRYAR